MAQEIFTEQGLFDKDVIGTMIAEKLLSSITLAPLAAIDDSLQGKSGDTVKLPFYGKACDGKIVRTLPVVIAKIGKTVCLADEEVLCGHGDPVWKCVREIVTYIAQTVDRRLLQILYKDSGNVYAPQGILNPKDVQKAMALTGNSGYNYILVCDSDFYAELIKEKGWIPAYEVPTELAVSGCSGMFNGIQVIVTDLVKGEDFFLVRRGALGLFMSRDVSVNVDRDMINQRSIITGSRLFALYMYKPGDAVRIVRRSGKASDTSENVCGAVKKTVNVLGTEYEIAVKKPGEDSKLENCDGYNDWTLHLICIIDPEKNDDSVGDMDAYKRKVLRHEITHAFLMESGLMENTNQGDSGGTDDEQMVDWFAIQGQKIYEAWKSVGAV